MDFGLTLRDWRIPFYCEGCGLEGGPHYREATIDDLVEALEAAGYEVVPPDMT